MSKFGVGVGDEFPVDDERGNTASADQGSTQQQANPEADRAEFEEWKRRRDAYRAQQDEWRKQREAHRAQREEWRDRKRAFKEKVRAAARESFGRDDFRDDDDYPRGFHHGWGMRRSRFPFFLVPFFGILIPIIIVAVLISIVAAIFKSPFVFLGLAILAFLFFAHRHNHRHHVRHRDYDLDLKARPMSPPPPAT
ncbi:MAG TPA: hypothetical protein VG309_12350 [Rhizomicrobium sp.]|jgi:Flp pilus assembly protein TadB|nr:hypothetical protein [Rhizomicrobium sp.]